MIDRFDRPIGAGDVVAYSKIECGSSIRIHFVRVLSVKKNKCFDTAKVVDINTGFQMIMPQSQNFVRMNNVNWNQFVENEVTKPAMKCIHLYADGTRCKCDARQMSNYCNEHKMKHVL